MKALWKIIRYSSELWRYYTVIAIMVVVMALLNLVNPFLTKSIVDSLVARFAGTSVEFSHLVAIIGLILASSVAGTLLSNVNGYYGDLLSTKLNNFLSQRYYEHLLKLPISYYDNEITGKITSRLDRSIVTISNLVQSLANNFIQFILTTVVTLVAIAFYSWKVALLLIVIFPTYIWLTHLSSKAWSKHQQSINKDYDYANGRFIEAITQIRVVKSFTTELRELSLFKSKKLAVLAKTRDQSVEWHRYDVYRQLVLNLVFALIYFFIVQQTFNKQLTIGQMTLLITLTTQARIPLFASSFIVDALQRAREGSKDYFEVMDTEPNIEDAPDAKPLKVREGKIEYKAVDFGYQKSKRVLDDISLTLEPGTKLALVGESGEGKTTITNLLMRFYEPTSGHILIDGQDISQVTQASLRAAVGVVFQEPALFSGTVEENIRYGVDKASQDEIEAAAKAANAHDFIKKLPEGYKTQIGERGVKLSGGQKQRIAIARAILKNPPILVLDEATSSLDTRAEREVQDALERLMRGRSTIIIAHRLSTIASVDNIAGIAGGRIVEFGAPAKLARGNGIYAELLKLQTSADNKSLRDKYQIAKT